MALGIDISYWQNDIDFGQMSGAGVTFVAVKAGGSNSGLYTDSKYVRHVSRARAAGMKIGHYWFNGNEAGVTQSANYFVDNLNGYTGDDLLVLDIENEGSMAAWSPGEAVEFFNVVRSRLPNAKLFVYMSSSVTRGGWEPVKNMGIGLWVAQYGNNNGVAGTPPTNLGPWGNDWDIWQFTSEAILPGYGARLDANLAKDSIFTASITTRKKKKMSLGDLVWTTDGKGMLITPEGVQVHIPNPGIYNFFYRIINSNQYQSPFSGGNMPERFYQSELDTVTNLVLLAKRAAAQGVAIDRDKLVSALNDAFKGKDITLEGLDKDEVIAAFDVAIPRITKAINKQVADKLAAASK